MHFRDRRVDVAVRNAAEADVTIRIVAAEIDKPVVVDAENLIRRRQVVHLGRGAEHAEDHLGVDTVAVHVLGAQMRITGPGGFLLAVGEQTGLGHDVDALVLAWYQLRAARPDAVLKTKVGAFL